MDRPIPCRRQADEGSQSRKGAIMAPERYHLPNRMQASLLTKTPWDSGWSTSARRVAARDQLPKGDTQHTWEGAPIVHPENRAVGTGEAISRSLQLGGNYTRQAPGHLSCSYLGRAQNSGPTKSVPLWRTGETEPEQLWTGKCTQPRTSLRQSRQSNLEPEQCRLGNHTRCEQGQTRCGRDTGSTPHRRQWYLFAVFLPPHSTAKKVSVKKVTTTAPLCQGGN